MERNDSISVESEKRYYEIHVPEAEISEDQLREAKVQEFRPVVEEIAKAFKGSLSSQADQLRKSLHEEIVNLTGQTKTDSHHLAGSARQLQAPMLLPLSRNGYNNAFDAALTAQVKRDGHCSASSDCNTNKGIARKMVKPLPPVSSRKESARHGLVPPAQLEAMGV